MRSLYALVHVDTGFHAENVLTLRLYLSPQKYSDWSRVRAFHEAALANLKAIPGVEAAALVEALPLSGRSIESPVALEGGGEVRERLTAEYNIVTPAYFRAMGIPLKAGRLLEEGDAAGGAKVAVVSRSAAQRFWPGENPLGKIIRNTGGYTDDQSRAVVGVVENEKHWNVWSTPDPKVYIPYSQAATKGAASSLRILTFAVVRTASDPEGIAAAARRAVWDVDADQPIVELKPMRRLVADSMATQRFQSLLIGSMAALALALASIGIYGVLAFLVARRRFEIGVRMALGAQRGDVMRSAMIQGLRPALVGIVLGMAAAAALSPVIEHELFGVEPFDALAYGGVAFTLLGAAALACYLPARRASRLDPLAALRHD